jgi:hypothetical protein
MVVKGIVRNGRLEVDLPPEWTEGTEVFLGVDGEEFVPHPEVREGTREEELAILREAYAEAKAGMGKPANLVFAEIAKEMGFPWPPRS